MSSPADRCRASLLLLVPLIGLTIPVLLHAQIPYKDQEIQIRNLPVLVANTSDSSDVLLTSLDTVFHDRSICCGKESALGDRAQAADPESLKDVAAKLEGRHVLGDGRSIAVKAEFATPDSVNSGLLITWMQGQHAALLEWKSHLYVVHGIIYTWIPTGEPDQGGSVETVVKRFLLWDTRFSDSRREVVFDREKDKLNEITGLLFVQASFK